MLHLPHAIACGVTMAKCSKTTYIIHIRIMNLSYMCVSVASTVFIYIIIYHIYKCVLYIFAWKKSMSFLLRGHRFLSQIVVPEKNPPTIFFLAFRIQDGHPNLITMLKIRRKPPGDGRRCRDGGWSLGCFFST